MEIDIDSSCIIVYSNTQKNKTGANLPINTGDGLLVYLTPVWSVDV
jgi:hypothetical protein